LSFGRNCLSDLRVAPPRWHGFFRMKIATLFGAVLLVAPAWAQQAPELISGCVPCHGANGRALWRSAHPRGPECALSPQPVACVSNGQTHTQRDALYDSQSDGRGNGGHRGLFLKPAAEVIGGEGRLNHVLGAEFRSIKNIVCQVIVCSRIGLHRGKADAASYAQ
jgi:hypothetical protein